MQLCLLKMNAIPLTLVTISATDITIMKCVDMMEATAALAMMKIAGNAQEWHVIVMQVEVASVRVRQEQRLTSKKIRK